MSSLKCSDLFLMLLLFSLPLCPYFLLFRLHQIPQNATIDFCLTNGKKQCIGNMALAIWGETANVTYKWHRVS